MNTPANFQSLTWHQQAKIRRDWKLRNLAAHIPGADYIATGKALCGSRNPRVTVDPDHRNNPANGTCKRCAAIADKMNLPTT
jgi:hypothetical protein